MARKNNDGRHEWYDADHGIQRDPLRDKLRDLAPRARDGWNINDLDLVINIFGAAIGRCKNEDGIIFDIEVKKKGADIKYAQLRTMELRDRMMSDGDADSKHWGGSWLLRIPEDLDNGVFYLQHIRDKTDRHKIHGIMELIRFFNIRAKAIAGAGVFEEG